MLSQDTIFNEVTLHQKCFASYILNKDLRTNFRKLNLPSNKYEIDLSRIRCYNDTEGNQGPFQVQQVTFRPHVATYLFFNANFKAPDSKRETEKTLQEQEFLLYISFTSMFAIFNLDKLKNDFSLKNERLNAILEDYTVYYFTQNYRSRAFRAALQGQKGDFIVVDRHFREVLSNFNIQVEEGQTEPFSFPELTVVSKEFVQCMMK